MKTARWPDALVQWVISMNLQPENNLADHYLDLIQRKPGQLEAESQAVKTFNQALWHAQNGSDDLAVGAACKGCFSQASFYQGSSAFSPAVYAPGGL